MDALLVVNPGSASRKYALYSGNTLSCRYHFEYENNQIIAHKYQGAESTKLTVQMQSLDDCLGVLAADCQNQQVKIVRVGVRLVAPGSEFLHDCLIDDTAIRRLSELVAIAPLHIAVLLDEINRLKKLLPKAVIIGVSDSRFHATKIEEAWNYGLPLDLTDQYELKRFGYHGISVSAAVQQLQADGLLPTKLIVCHLGSGSSVTAVQNGKSYDTTMGYSPFEGLIMATRSGTVDYMALQTLKFHKQLDEPALFNLISKQSGLLGLSGVSDDLRLVLDKMQAGDHRSKLAIMTMAYRIVTAIGGMAAAMNGADGLVFTGTVGERSAILRRIVMSQLGYIGFQLDEAVNQATTSPVRITAIMAANSRPVFVVPTNENDEIARRASAFQL